MCNAVQHMRPLVRDAWGPGFAQEIALHAWELSYLQVPPHFQAAECRNGGQLDRMPSSEAWAVGP